MRSCCSPRSRGCGAAACTAFMRRRMRTWTRWPPNGGGGGGRGGGGGGVDAGRLRRQGLRFLEPGRALAALGQVLAADEMFVAVADVGWGRVGAADAGRLRRQGLRFLEPGRALAALGQVLAADEMFVAVADVDWARFAPVYRAA